MFDIEHSTEELHKFLQEILDNELAIDIYQQLMEDGGNTASGISENLKAKGKKASLTRVYEEIAKLQNYKLIKRISKRPPIYTTIQTQDNLEQIALKLIVDTRQNLLRKWAAMYPFLPKDMKSTDVFSKSLSGGPLINFNPYPIVDIYNIKDKEEMMRYFLKVFEQNEIFISNILIDTCLSADTFRSIFQKDKLSILGETIQENFDRKGRLTIKTLSSWYSRDLLGIKEKGELSKYHKQIVHFIDYEIREKNSEQELSSFVIGENCVWIPIGIGGINQETFSVLEIRDEKILKKAKTSFQKAWANSKKILEVKDGSLTVF